MFHQIVGEAGPYSMSTYSKYSPRTAHNSDRVSQLSGSRYVPSPDISIELSANPALRHAVSRSPGTSIYNLNDDALLTIFYLSRPSAFEEDRFGGIMWGNWARERWWYKLVQVCRRWRGLIFDSVSHLGLCLVCTPGTPVADMLAHSPPLPLIIDYEHYFLTTEDEEGIALALQHRDRVRRINLRTSVPKLQKFITALNDEFPMLEYLYITPPAKHDTLLVLPTTFEAPHLNLLILNHFVSPIGSPLLTTAVGLLTLALRWIHPSTYPHPNQLLEQISLLPQLEALEIGFCSPVPNREIERQLLHGQITTHVTLPNLLWFSFWGISAYFEALLPHVTTPLVKDFKVHFFSQLSFSVPRLLQFMMTAENLRFISVRFLFYYEAVAVYVARDGAEVEDFFMQVFSYHLDWQVSSVAQIFHVLSPLFSTVAELDLDYRTHTLSSEGHEEADRKWWRQFLASFRNVKTLRVHNGLVGEVSRALRSEGEPPLELLPELKELVCPASSVEDKTFVAFVHEREDAGQPVNLVGKAYPVGFGSFFFISSTGGYNVDPDPDPDPDSPQ